MDSQRLYSLLKRVEKPSRYLGSEVNSIHKDFDAAEVRVALVFPDAYEIGMSHVGLKILYDILNKMPHVVAERCFAPGLDLEKELRQEGLPLFSLESKRPLRDFDIIGVSLTYELTYTNMLNILDLAGIPLWQKDRKEGDPIILAGGGCTMNAEPVADFLDAALLGDGEEGILDIVERVRKWKKETSSRTFLLDQLSAIEGVYIPSLFRPEYKEDGTIAQVVPLKEGYTKVNKRVLESIDRAPYPTALVVPSIKIVHDRIGIEIQRGCNRACRFCQAGYIDRPVRQRSPESILKIAEESYQQTGIDEISLLSLSAADYACIVPLLAELNERYSKRKVSLSVPATRTEKLTPELIEQIKKVRKTGFTIAPEAGSERMRRVINKGNKVDDLLNAITNAFKAGWHLVKMYYMVGLPFENEEDVVGIAREGMECISIGRNYSGRAELHLSVSSFVPKPHTPFQWAPQLSIEQTETRHHLVKTNIPNRRIKFKHHNSKMSFLEGIFSRGDRRVATLIHLAFQAGCRFDEWDEHFDFQKWQEAIAKWGLNPEFYLHRARDREEIFPWDHLFAQMDKKFLWDELELARKEAFTEDCSVARCTDCGVCDFRVVKNRIYVTGDQPVMVKKGNREAYGWQGAGPVSTSSPTVLQTAARGGGPPSVEPPPPCQLVYKLRARYTKTGEARFMGHLELVGMLKRAINRMGVVVSYSQGFHPQMRLSMGHPLPVGVESEWEYFDLELAQEINPSEFQKNLNPLMPIGVQILDVEMVDRKSPSLYASLQSIGYSASFEEADKIWPTTAKTALKDFGESKEFYWTRERENKTKRFDLKQKVEVNLQAFPEYLLFHTRVDPNGTINPHEVLKALFGFDGEALSSIRLKKVGVHFNNSII